MRTVGNRTVLIDSYAFDNTNADTLAVDAVEYIHGGYFIGRVVGSGCDVEFHVLDVVADPSQQLERAKANRHQP